MSNTAELVLDAKNITGESPVWDGESGTLWWTDIPSCRIHNLDPGAGALRSYSAPGRVGCFALRKAGGLVVAMEHGFSTFDPETGTATLISEPEAGLEDHRFNDGRCDPAGRFLAGSMNLAKKGPTAQLWRLELDRSTTRLAGGITIANGLAFSPDGRKMYWLDGPAEEVYVFDYDVATGALGERQVWLSKGAGPGRGDGAAVDSEGCYWSARWLGGCVVRFTPQGAIDRIIKVAASRVTMCAFGDADLKTLYITTAREGMSPEDLAREPLAGGLFAYRADVAGMPEPRFLG